MARSKAKHDHYKGSIIEYFDTVTPIEKPKKRVYGPGVDVRKEKMKENERRFQAQAAEERRAAKAEQSANSQLAQTKTKPSKETAKKRRALQKESEKARKKMRSKITRARKRHVEGAISLEEKERLITTARKLCALEEEFIAKKLKELE